MINYNLKLSRKNEKEGGLRHRYFDVEEIENIVHYNDRLYYHTETK